MSFKSFIFAIYFCIIFLITFKDFLWINIYLSIYLIKNNVKIVKSYYNFK